MRPEYVAMTHKDAGEAQVPPHRVAHYEAKGWKQSKPPKSTADRPAKSPQGDDTTPSERD
jgi:hypothetical protein